MLGKLIETFMFHVFRLWCGLDRTWGRVDQKKVPTSTNTNITYVDLCGLSQKQQFGSFGIAATY